MWETTTTTTTTKLPTFWQCMQALAAFFFRWTGRLVSFVIGVVELTEEADVPADAMVRTP